MWKVEIRKDRFVLLAHFPDSEHYFTFKRPPPLLDLFNPHHHSLVIIWREVSDALPSPSSIPSLATKTKIVFEFGNQHIYSPFLWKLGLGYIRQSPNIDIWPKFFTKYWQLTISSSGKERHPWRGGERGKVIYVTRSTLPHFHFILHTFNILHLSFTFYILFHKIDPFFIITYVHLKFNIFRCASISWC